jgi:hypothetical protein
MRYEPCSICKTTGRAIGGGLCGGCAGHGYIFVSESKTFTPPAPGGRSSGGCGCLLVLAIIALIAMNSRPSRPLSTDNKRPQGVTEQQFKKDPTFGKLQIAKFLNVYKYYDTVFMQKYTWDKNPIHGYTFSKTPPDENVKTIQEIYTAYQDWALTTPQIVSQNREIPRENVIPLPYKNGDHYGQYEGEAYYYSPPASASRYELEKAATLLRNNEK